MAKKKGNVVSRKQLPSDIVREIGTTGVRVWKWKGREFLTKMDFLYNRPIVHPEETTFSENIELENKE